ncbi:four helix bundle protein [Saccharicrinis sp. GN24d3]|uniref:four helix bundle protein n=1 Tax=Saccharicrinis sp. GN24d3 TaxID=3458416 RepID=UPI0040374C91
MAEGYGRNHFKEKKNFVFHSRGSAYGTKRWVKRAYKRKLISNELYEQLLVNLESFLKVSTLI